MGGGGGGGDNHTPSLDPEGPCFYFSLSVPLGQIQSAVRPIAWILFIFFTCNVRCVFLSDPTGY